MTMSPRKMTIRALLIEDSPTDARLVRQALSDRRLPRVEVELVETLEAGVERLARESFDVLLLDLFLPDSDGYQTFEAAFLAAPDVPILILTGLDDEDLAARAVRAGAQDFFPKDRLDGGVLHRALRHAIERKQVQSELARSNRELRSFRRVSEVGLLAEPVETVLDLILEEVLDASGFASTWIELLDPERQTPWRVARRGRMEGGSWGEEARSLSDQAVFKGKVHIVAGDDGTAICAPLRAYGLTVGTLGLSHPDRREPDERFLHWFEALAGHVAAIAESRRATEKLHFHGDILANVTDSVIATTPDGTILYWNQGATRLFGYTAEEALGRKTEFLIPEGDDMDLDGTLDEASRTAGVHFSEWRGRRKDGSDVWVEIQVTPFMDRQGNLQGFVSVGKDVTERRRAAEAQARLIAILEAANDFIGIASPQGTVLYMNRAGQTLLGAGPEDDLTGTEIARYSPEWANRLFVEEGFPTAAREGSWTGVGAFLDTVGREIPISLVIVAHKSQGGEVEFFSTIAHDITERLQQEEELKSLHRTLQALVEASPLGIVAMDTEGRVSLWSPAAERTFGWRADEVLGKPLVTILPDDKRDEHVAFVKSVLAGQRFTGIETRRCDRAGLPIDLRISAAPLQDADGHVRGMAEFLEDINDRKRVESAIRRLASLPEQSPDPLIELDLAGSALYVNQAARGRFPDLQALGSWHPVLRNLSTILPRFRQGERKSFSFEVSHDQRIYHQMIYFVPDGSLVRVFLQDITEQRRAEAILERESLQDRLTGLANRRLFLRQLDEHLKNSQDSSQHFAVLSINLDRFKVINDSLGEAAGDHLLVEISQRLARCLTPDDLLARLGSDEFAVLLRRTSGLSSSLQVAGRLREAIILPLEISRQEVFPSASLGIAPGESYTGAEALLRDANIAMYRAKSLGGGRCEIFDRAMGQRSLDRLRMENELRRAVERGDLRMHYQPILRLCDGEVVAHEALMRWPRAEKGMVPPVEFIPVAEESGLMPQLFYWTLGEVCQRLREWSPEAGGGSPLAIHLNISGRVFSDPSLVQKISATLKEARLEGDRLVLEITESVLMEDPVAAVEVLRRIKELGVGLSLDDFGTGYSSLSYLQQFPIDSLKIDRSFVAKIGSRGENREILHAVLTLAQRLGVEVIAEGLETELQLAQLKEMGCRLGQGFLFSRPVDRDAAYALMERRPWQGLFSKPQSQRHGRTRLKAVGGASA
jgi:diguanylate cyclase (GGDEF)-like protein/PAS domain S-box-containing protein